MVDLGNYVLPLYLSSAPQTALQMKSAFKVWCVKPACICHTLHCFCITFRSSRLEGRGPAFFNGMLFCLLLVFWAEEVLVFTLLVMEFPLFGLSFKVLEERTKHSLLWDHIYHIQSNRKLEHVCFSFTQKCVSIFNFALLSLLFKKVGGV